MSVQERWPGHYWKREPVWGYVNEADPAVMEMEINQAVKHGVNVFVFDWYWYDDRPFMETTLNNGFLKAENSQDMDFYLMWANHDVVNLWDTRLYDCDEHNVIWKAGVDREEFERMCRRNIEKYFKQPNYYKIDGKPVFMIYDIVPLVEGLGGLEETIDALAWFRKETRKAGFPGLDLQIVVHGNNMNYSGVDGTTKYESGNEFFTNLGFNSATHYQFAHFIWMDDEYANIVNSAVQEWEELDKDLEIPYYPHVSVGWDNSPRTKESAVSRNNTPEEFQRALQAAKDFVDARPELHPLITINSWNEWTETSYLQPDNLYGYGYLEAVRNVFGPATR
ncbi:MAG: glycoside hydrolase family 99-like domain-containing protein, partial [Oscillospiraceae bacterium]|nr:glycoside hydrolase family 99-like domain-containing protein [Oscillospiraceae bacterium]